MIKFSEEEADVLFDSFDRVADFDGRWIYDMDKRKNILIINQIKSTDNHTKRGRLFILLVIHNKLKNFIKRRLEFLEKETRWHPEKKIREEDLDVNCDYIRISFNWNKNDEMDKWCINFYRIIASKKLFEEYINEI